MNWRHFQDSLKQFGTIWKNFELHLFSLKLDEHVFLYFQSTQCFSKLEYSLCKNFPLYPIKLSSLYAVDKWLSELGQIHLILTTFQRRTLLTERYISFGFVRRNNFYFFLNTNTGSLSWSGINVGIIFQFAGGVTFSTTHSAVVICLTLLDCGEASNYEDLIVPN